MCVVCDPCCVAILVQLICIQIVILCGPFSEGEAFESFCPSRMDALLKEARTVEENLKEQKDALKSRLQQIAHTLEMLS